MLDAKEGPKSQQVIKIRTATRKEIIENEAQKDIASNRRLVERVVGDQPENPTSAQERLRKARERVAREINIQDPIRHAREIIE